MPFDFLTSPCDCDDLPSSRRALVRQALRSWHPIETSARRAPGPLLAALVQVLHSIYIL